jgi:hypothetical protein
MQPKTRMTFRFDPPKPAPRPLPVNMHAVPSIEPTQPKREHVTEDEHPTQPDIAPSEHTAYYSGGPLQDDLYTLEQMIRTSEPIRVQKSVKVVPVKADLHEEKRSLEHLTYSEVGSAEWSEPGDAGNRMEGWLSGALNRNEGPSWWRVIASVAGAVATGALFGYLVLTLFTGDSPFPAAPLTGKDTPVQAKAPSTPTALPGQGAAPSAASQAGQPAKPTILNGSTFYLLQYGVFRTEESMRAAMEELKRKGLPAAADRTDGYRVYAGAADSKEEANLLAGQLSGIEVYVKPSVSQGWNPNEAEGADALAVFVQRSAELTRSLSRLSVSALQEEQPKPFEQAALVTLRENHNLWLESAKSTEGLTGAALQSAKDLQQSLHAAMVSVDDYSRKISRYHLWDIQSKVMQAVLSDRALRAALLSGTPK